MMGLLYLLLSEGEIEPRQAVRAPTKPPAEIYFEDDECASLPLGVTKYADQPRDKRTSWLPIQSYVQRLLDVI